MGCYYLRIEGINLDNFVYDTNDLSTVRGGGLLMLRLVDQVETFLNDHEHVTAERITNGASWGLYRIAIEADFQPETLFDAITSHLNGRQVTCKIPKKNGEKKEITITPWRHATWAVDIIKAGDQEHDFRADREKAQALNRWRQMQTPALTLPGPEEYKSDVKESVCDFDLVNPAFIYLKEEKKAISHFVSDRRQYGRCQKQEFYEGETRLPDLQEFVNDLNDLTEIQGNSKAEEAVKSLSGKMAVIYMDGNSFGRTQRDHCLTPADQTDFNDTVIGNHRDFLTDILRAIDKDDPLWFNNGAIRFETLLWGGDEIMLVVPAWQGWEVLTRFYRMAKDWKYKNRKLTYGAGLVFCHHKAPIYRIKDLAHNLADLAKAKGKEAGYVAYQILESFDHAGLDLQGFRAGRCPVGVVPNDLILPGEQMSAINEAMESLKEEIDLPKRKLHQVVAALYAGDMDQADRLAEKAGFNDKDIAAMIDAFGRRPACWLHILELWDYLGLKEV